MSYNTRKLNQDSYYSSKSTKELEILLRTAQEFVKKHTKFEYGMHNEYIHMLKLKIAERIGKK